MATEPFKFEDRLPPGWIERGETRHRVLEILSARAVSRRRRNRRVIVGGAIATVFALAAAIFQPARLVAPDSVPVIAGRPILQSTLPDGSRIEHKPGSAYTVDYTNELRHIMLLRGTAHFDVAKNPHRPFVVTAGGVTIRAVGTAFSVAHDQDRIEVLVTEGRVAVASLNPGGEAPTAVDAGEGVLLNASQTSAVGVARLEKIPAAAFEEKLAWRVKVVELSGTPLKDAMRILNEHNRVQFIIADESLAELKLSGVIRADRVLGVVKFLQGEGITVEVRNDREFVLRRTRND